MRKYFLLTLLAVFAFIAIGNAAANEAKPMKVVFIQADDLGWSDTELDEALRSLRQSYPEINSSSELANSCTISPRDKLEIACQKCFINHGKRI